MNNDDMQRRVAAAIDGDKLCERLKLLGKIGQTASGGIDRQALSAADVEAHRLLIKWGRQDGFAVLLDEAGNLFLRREGASENEAAVMTGSHLDTQPDGGRFDGAYGVLAGLAVLDALEKTGVVTRKPIEVVAWNNEEGCRFSPGTMGSMVFSGKARVADFRPLSDKQGTTFGEALDAMLACLSSEADGWVCPRTPHAYIETHIEQGPILERERKTIGVVRGIQGVRWFEVTVKGSSNHAGTTPRSGRHDALMHAVALIPKLDATCRDQEDLTRFTIGSFAASPGTINCIPGVVTFSIDLRHPAQSRLEGLEAAIRRICGEATGNGFSVAVKRLQSLPPADFPLDVAMRIAQSATLLGLPNMPIVSGAFHDALNITEVCPTGMIFIPCVNGISHNPAEDASPADLVAGAKVLASVIADMAGGA